MWDVNYGTFEELEKHLMHKRITAWDRDKLVLEDGTTITIEMSESDCCASAGGIFRDVKLDAVITDISIVQEETTPVSEEDAEYWDYDGNTNYAEVRIFSNNNPIAIADCSANDGNGGYYYSVCALKIKDVYYPVVRA